MSDRERFFLRWCVCFVLAIRPFPISIAFVCLCMCVVCALFAWRMRSETVCVYFFSFSYFGLCGNVLGIWKCPLGRYTIYYAACARSLRSFVSFLCHCRFFSVFTPIPQFISSACYIATWTLIKMYFTYTRAAAVAATTTKPSPPATYNKNINFYFRCVLLLLPRFCFSRLDCVFLLFALFAAGSVVHSHEKSWVSKNEFIFSKEHIHKRTQIRALWELVFELFSPCQLAKASLLISATLENGKRK